MIPQFAQSIWSAISIWLMKFKPVTEPGMYISDEDFLPNSTLIHFFEKYTTLRGSQIAEHILKIVNISTYVTRCPLIRVIANKSPPAFKSLGTIPLPLHWQLLLCGIHLRQPARLPRRSTQGQARWKSPRCGLLLWPGPPQARRGWCSGGEPLRHGFMSRVHRVRIRALPRQRDPSSSLHSAGGHPPLRRGGDGQ